MTEPERPAASLRVLIREFNENCGQESIRLAALLRSFPASEQTSGLDSDRNPILDRESVGGSAIRRY